MGRADLPSVPVTISTSTAVCDNPPILPGTARDESASGIAVPVVEVGAMVIVGLMSRLTVCGAAVTVTVFRSSSSTVLPAAEDVDRACVVGLGVTGVVGRGVGGVAVVLNWAAAAKEAEAPGVVGKGDERVVLLGLTFDDDGVGVGGFGSSSPSTRIRRMFGGGRRERITLSWS